MWNKNLSSLAALLIGCASIWAVGCSESGEEQLSSTGGASTSASASMGDSYTLRVVFRGLVALVPDDESTSSPRFWALVGNASQPERLDIHVDPDDDTVELHPHQARLFVRAGNVLESSPLGTGQIRCEDGQEGSWSVLDLGNMDVTLEGELESRGLQVVRNNRPRGQERPCEPGKPGCSALLAVEQARSFDWAAPFEPLVAAATGGTGQLRKAFFDPVGYRPEAGEIPLLLARFRFDAGTVTTRSLDRNEHQQVEVYQFTHAEEVPPQALSTTVALEVAMKGPARFQMVALDDTTKQLPDLVVQPAEGEREVEVWIDNSPDACMSGGHFLFNYNLLENTHLKRLPRPQVRLTEGGPPGDNGGCTPPRMTKPQGS